MGDLALRLPPELARGGLVLGDDIRSMGAHLVAGKGAGKSRLLGRFIAWQDFLRQTPLIVFDPFGPVIDNFLDKLLWLPAAEQQKLASRIVYVPTAGMAGRIIPFPLYYRIGLGEE